MISFPFWLVKSRTIQIPAPNGGNAELPVAFSRAESMTAYMEAREGGRWDVRLVTRETGLAALGDLHESGHAAICWDPESDGRGGRELSLADIIVYLRSSMS